MNIYVSNVGNKGFDIKKEVINRYRENDLDDLFNAIVDYCDEDQEKIDNVFDVVSNLSIEELSDLTSVDENSLEFDETETHEWGCKGGFAYSVRVDFEIDRIINK